MSYFEWLLFNETPSFYLYHIWITDIDQDSAPKRRKCICIRARVTVEFADVEFDGKTGTQEPFKGMKR